MADINANFTHYPTAHFRRMSDDQCRRIHWASLEVMERTGVRLYLQDAIDLLRRAGAHVSEGNRVRIPSALVEKAFTTVPRRIVLCDRHGNRVISLEGYRSFFQTGLADHPIGQLCIEKGD